MEHQLCTKCGEKNPKLTGLYCKDEDDYVKVKCKCGEKEFLLSEFLKKVGDVDSKVSIKSINVPSSMSLEEFSNAHLKEMEKEKTAQTKKINELIIKLTKYKNEIEKAFSKAKKRNENQIQFLYYINKTSQLQEINQIIFPNKYIYKYSESFEKDVFSPFNNYFTYLKHFSLIDLEHNISPEDLSSFLFDDIPEGKLNKYPFIVQKSYGEEGIYYGEVKEGLKNGRGLFRTKTEDVLSGFWKDNYIVKGKKRYIDGEFYEGTFKNNLEEGEGVRIYNNGKYEGSFKNGKRHGLGKMTMSDTSTYSGEWKDDFIDGFGVYKWLSGAEYKGDFHLDQRNGHGVETYANGDIYQGEYKNNRKNGLGYYFWKNGDRFIGEWKEGNKTNKGLMFEGRQKTWNEEHEKKRKNKRNLSM